jgi:hypothetical protein
VIIFNQDGNAVAVDVFVFCMPSAIAANEPGALRFGSVNFEE